MSTICIVVLLNNFTNEVEEDIESIAIEKANALYSHSSVKNIEKVNKELYNVNVLVDYKNKIFEYSGELVLSLYKQNEEWQIDVIEDTVSYKLLDTDYYYFNYRFGGNETYLMQFTNVTKDNISLKYYSHDLGNYGKDIYDYDTKICELTYNNDYGCFEFEFAGFWRIHSDYIEFIHYEHGQYAYEKYKTINPVDPNNYWWYEHALRYTGNYGEGINAELSQAEVGGSITFGKYEMDNDLTNGEENIVWDVLDKNDKAIFVISKYILTNQKEFNTYGTWENSPTRTWLNDTFFKSAFNDEEQSKIISTKVINNNNSKYGTNGGNDTIDKVFLLSEDETNKYFEDKEDRKVYPTSYALTCVDTGFYSDYGYWWLRTPGEQENRTDEEQKNITVTKEVYVGANGYIYTEGYETIDSGCGIRPAMWISTQ